MLVGAILLLCARFQHVDNEKHKKHVAMSLLCYRTYYLPDGGIQWLLVKPWAFSIKRCVQLLTGALLLPLKRPAKLVYLFIVVCLLLPLQPPGQYWASSCPMAASSGFRYRPGHAALGNAVCIAPAHCHGNQNGQQRRCIHSSLLPFLYDNS